MAISTYAWLPRLRAQLDALAQKPTGAEAPARLLAALKELDVILAQHRTEIPHDLVHYLERRSYEKASNYCRELAQGSTCPPRSSH